jgi:hypothetical protein
MPELVRTPEIFWAAARVMASASVMRDRSSRATSPNNQLRRFEGAPVSTVHWRWYGDERRKQMVLSDAAAAASV